MAETAETQIRALAGAFDLDAIRSRVKAVFDEMTVNDRDWHNFLCDRYDRDKAAKALEANLAAMNVPQGFRSLPRDLDDGDWQKVAALVENARERRDGIVILCGASGIGKTHFACWCLARLAEDRDSYGMPRLTGRYVSSPQVAALYKKADARNAATERGTVFARAVQVDLRKADFVAVDEIGLETRLEEYERQFLYDLFDGTKQMALLCTNKSPSELKALMGEALYDRVRGCCVLPNLAGLKSRRGSSAGEVADR